jgi:peptidyl-prolyl cis-trans isomerase B (cyclophilin B)
VGKQERQRKLARERYERQMNRRSQRARRVRQWTVISGAGIAVIALAVVGYFIFAPAGGTPAAAPTKSSTPSPSTSSPAPAVQPAAAVSHCTYTPAPPAARNVGIPPAKPDTKASYVATVHTNRGNIVIKMSGSNATCTVNSFVYLAGKNYLSNTKCHRLTTGGIYVLQCGDPTGKGTGGPGYRFASEVMNDSTTASATYPAGVVAMAHSSQPNSNGSQFFLVYAKTTLPRDYTPFGTITSGLNLVTGIAKAGVASNANGAGDGPPKESVIIKSVSIKRT